MFEEALPRGHRPTFSTLNITYITSLLRLYKALNVPVAGVRPKMVCVSSAQIINKSPISYHS